MKNTLITVLKSRFPWLFRRLLAIKKQYHLARFKKVFPNTQIFAAERVFDRKFYGQHGQDQIVFDNFFKEKKHGFYCDIGGNHPLLINNTLFFEEQGWTGIAFEPLPYMEKLWRAKRNTKLFTIALSDEEDELDFVIVDPRSGWEDMLSYVETTGSSCDVTPAEKLIVRARKFADVALEQGINEIDYMSIDVEGHELKVLQGINFEEVRINVLTVENNRDPNHTYGDDTLRDFLTKKGFIFWGRIVGLDDIYVHEEFLQSMNTKV